MDYTEQRMVYWDSGESDAYSIKDYWGGLSRYEKCQLNKKMQDWSACQFMKADESDQWHVLSELEAHGHWVGRAVGIRKRPLHPRRCRSLHQAQEARLPQRDADLRRIAVRRVGAQCHQTSDHRRHLGIYTKGGSMTARHKTIRL